MKTSTEHQAVPLGLDQLSNPPTQSFFEDPLKIRTMLVAVDFSDESFRALDFALPLAKRFSASVQLVYVYEGKPQFSSMVNTPELFSDPAIELFSDREIAGRLKDQVQRRFSIDLPRQDCHFRTGRPSTEICAAAHKLNADLIVIATHGRTGLKHLTLGSTAEKTVRHAPCPVLVVREATRGPIKTAAEGIVLEKILVPVDFSECAREGAKYASVFATRVGADLLLMHVAYPRNYTASDVTIVPPEWPQLVETARLLAEDNLEKIVNFLPLVGISAETEVALGTPIDKLVEGTARPDVDMVIISTHGYTGLRHVLLGSTAEQLVRLARCPVLVVPSHCRQMAD
ncbi:MAG TPA: universal stress protein [Chthoniobacterales bacterium]